MLSNVYQTKKRLDFVNRRNRTKSLKQAIKDKELQLAKLKTHVDKSTICSDLYNRMVLEKAILGKELQDLGKNSFITTVRNIIPRKKVLICDYFK